MTPSEQDKELQKAVWASLASQITHSINCTDLEHENQDSCEDFTKKNFEQLMKLITANYTPNTKLKALIEASEKLNLELHGRPDCKNCSLQEQLAELIKDNKL